MWNFVKNFPWPLPFPIITGHGTEKVFLMKFEILGLDGGDRLGPKTKRG